MGHLKQIALAVSAALIMAALVGAGTASATTLEVGGVTKNESVSGTATLKSGTSIRTGDTFGFTLNTCAESHGAGSTSTYTGAIVTGSTSELTHGKCVHEVTFHDPGQLYIEWTSGTNGRVFSENAEGTAYSTIHGTDITCKTGAGTFIGTLTGTASGHATLDVNAVLNCNPHVGSTRWSGTFTVTTPTGLGVSP